jgi:hypothetical protein
MTKRFNKNGFNLFKNVRNRSSLGSNSYPKRTNTITWNTEGFNRKLEHLEYS